MIFGIAGNITNTKRNNIIRHFVGITIDTNMNWKIHTNLVKTRLYYGIPIQEII